MIKKFKSELHTIDERGIKSQIREQGVKFDGVEIVECPKGKVRGNHYHKGKNEYLHVFSGQVKLETMDPDGKEEELLIEQGEYVIVTPHTRHRITGIEDSLLIIPFQGSSSIEDSHPWI